MGVNYMNNKSEKYSLLELSGEELTHEKEIFLLFNRNASGVIKSRRKDLGWSQEELAERANVARSTISSVERNNRSLSMDAFIKLMDALNMKIVLEPNQ
jgi:DNA-binding XRE family transcriptional regulator